MPRYQQIARQLKNAIEKGELKPGQICKLFETKNKRKNHFYFRQLHVKPLAKQYIELMINLKIKRQQINTVKSRHLIKN